MRHARAALAVSFFVHGTLFALLVTRIPAIQHHYGISNGLLPVFLAAVPILAGFSSVATERLVKRVRPSVVLRWVQPGVGLALIGLGAGDQLWMAVATLALFGVCIGGLDSSVNMLGVSLQGAYGRSIMLSIHAAHSFGAILGASLAWSGAHWHLSLFTLYGPTALVLIPLALAASRWYRDREPDDRLSHDGVSREKAGKPGLGGGQVVMKLLLPLCLVMAVAFIGEGTVSNWSAKYLQDTLHSSEQLSTVPFAVYMVMSLIGRSTGDFGVRRFGSGPVVRLGTVVAVAGFAAVAVAPGAWTGILGFTMVGLGLCVLVPQTFAAAGRMFPLASDSAIARLNIFNYVGFVVGSPLVGAVGGLWSYRVAMIVPAVLVAVTLLFAKSFDAGPVGYGAVHERPRTADVA
ncbi:MFS transporter [Streptomyces mirabilis]|uniref:MFS transporter n=1 Tax=Streptomyces mirabilis TaxID=68239 RepID=UPI0036E0A5D8